MVPYMASSGIQLDPPPFVPPRRQLLLPRRGPAKLLTAAVDCCGCCPSDQSRQVSFMPSNSNHRTIQDGRMSAAVQHDLLASRRAITPRTALLPSPVPDVTDGAISQRSVPRNSPRTALLADSTPKDKVLQFLGTLLIFLIILVLLTTNYALDILWGCLNDGPG